MKDSVRDKLKAQYEEYRNEYDETSWKAEKATSACNEAKNEYDFHTQEASGAWGQSAPSNTEEKRAELRDKYRDKEAEMRDALYEKEMAKQRMEEAQKELEDYDQEVGY